MWVFKLWLPVVTGNTITIHLKTLVEKEKGKTQSDWVNRTFSQSLSSVLCLLTFLQKSFHLVFQMVSVHLSSCWEEGRKVECVLNQIMNQFSSAHSLNLNLKRLFVRREGSSLFLFCDQSFLDLCISNCNSTFTFPPSLCSIIFVILPFHTSSFSSHFCFTVSEKFL